MNTDTRIELSSSSSGESLDEGREPSIREIKRKETTSEDENIEISGSKDEEPTIVDSSVGVVSRSESVVRDVRRLKSATLDRMGKMLKINSKMNGEKPEVMNVSVSSEDTTRKQKFNSLTRMLRFTDKEDKSQPLGQYRGRSLKRILRRKVPSEGDNPQGKSDEHIRGIFSRILGQIRKKHGRASKADSSSENFSQKNRDKPILSPQLTSESALSNLNLKNSDPEINTCH